ncbi:hypothetical protein D3C76_841580 [compost metagenome]
MRRRAPGTAQPGAPRAVPGVPRASRCTHQPGHAGCQLAATLSPGRRLRPTLVRGGLPRLLAQYRLALLQHGTAGPVVPWPDGTPCRRPLRAAAHAPRACQPQRPPAGRPGALFPAARRPGGKLARGSATAPDHRLVHTPLRAGDPGLSRQRTLRHLRRQRHRLHAARRRRSARGKGHRALPRGPGTPPGPQAGGHARTAGYRPGARGAARSGAGGARPGLPRRWRAAAAHEPARPGRPRTTRRPPGEHAEISGRTYRGTARADRTG